MAVPSFLDAVTGLRRHLLTGVSYAIPFIAAGGIMIAFAIAFAPMSPTGPDFSQSPALKILELLVQCQAVVEYHDPFVPSLQDEHGVTRHSVPLTARALAEADCVLITTDHNQTDWASVVRHAQVIVDTRNATKNVTERRDNIVLL